MKHKSQLLVLGCSIGERKEGKVGGKLTLSEFQFILCPTSCEFVRDSINDHPDLTLFSAPATLLLDPTLLLLYRLVEEAP